MKMLFSLPANDLIQGSAETDYENRQEGACEQIDRCSNFVLHRYDELVLMKGSLEVDLSEYQRKNDLPSISAAAVDIELRENRIEVVRGDELPKIRNFRVALNCATTCAHLVVDHLKRVSPNEKWVLWINFQTHLGDFDEDLDDDLKMRARDLINNDRGWWYQVDLSFAKHRPLSDEFVRQRLPRQWGESLSPIQMLCFS